MHIRMNLNACQQSTHRVSPCQEEEQLRQLSEVASNPNLKNYKNWSKIWELGNYEIIAQILPYLGYSMILGYTIAIAQI